MKCTTCHANSERLLSRQPTGFHPKRRRVLGMSHRASAYEHLAPCDGRREVARAGADIGPPLDGTPTARPRSNRWRHGSVFKAPAIQRGHRARFPQLRRRPHRRDPHLKRFGSAARSATNWSRGPCPTISPRQPSPRFACSAPSHRRAISPLLYGLAEGCR